MRISDWSSDVCSSDLTTLVAGIAAAIALEATPEDGGARDWSFAALYGAGCIAGLISAWIVARLPEPRLPAPPAKAIGLIERLRSPFRDRNFARPIVFLGPWQFSINFAQPFFTAYLLPPPIGRPPYREHVGQYL